MRKGAKKMLGIPYKGSKRKLAEEIISFIRINNPEARNFYDLFGGGGAISMCASHYFENVFYNELDSGVCKLFEFCLNNKIPEDWYQWVSREQFHELKTTPTPYGGMVKQCWSFGNNGKDYLFSKENEELKMPLHNAIVNLCEKSLKDSELKLGIEMPVSLLDEKLTIHKRWLLFKRHIQKSCGRFELQQLEQL